MRRLLLVLAAILIPSVCLAGAPTTGTYLSTDVGGSMLVGRFSESFVTPAGPGQIGNTIHAQSYDGALGTQWSLGCVSIAQAPTMISDTRDLSGTGLVTYETVYDEGTFFLAGSGPWGDGSEDYTGVIFTFVNTSTHEYIGGQLTQVVSNVVISGIFDGYADCMDFIISNSFTVGTTPDAGAPADYPEFMDPNCGFTPMAGAWGVVPTIRLTIRGDCTVEETEASFGTLKSRW
jgi:hypothetical protein